jgi:hypothetical protein
MKVFYKNKVLYQQLSWKAQSIPLGTIRHYLAPPLSWIDQAYFDFDTEALHNLDVSEEDKEYELNVNVLLRGILGLQYNGDLYINCKLYWRFHAALAMRSSIQFAVHI